MSAGKKPNALRAALAVARNKDEDGNGEPDFGSDPLPFAVPQEADETETQSEVSIEDGTADLETEATVAESERETPEPAATYQAHSPAEAIYTNGLAPPERTVKMGRPTGKRSDPDYTPMIAYIPIDLHEDVKEELLGINRIRRRQKLPALQISDVVEMQLSAWLKMQKGENSDV